jgi:hypothetical protein
VVIISALEIARDIQLAESVPGVDAILNSDRHERITQPIHLYRHARHWGRRDPFADPRVYGQIASHGCRSDP